MNKKTVRSKIDADVRNQFEPVLRALPEIKSVLSGRDGVVGVRPGYTEPDRAKVSPAVIVSFRPGSRLDVDLKKLESQFSIKIVSVPASIEEQLAALQTPTQGRQGPVAFAGSKGGFISGLEMFLRTAEPSLAFGPPRTGAYTPLHPPKLPLVQEKMEVRICVSPEAGWSPLKAFLEGTESELMIGMYQFTAPHIYKKLKQVVTARGRELTIVLHPVPEPPSRCGTKAHDLNEKDQVLKPLHKAMGKRFKFSWATLRSKTNPNGLWASAYHIKVAVRDKTAFWLSSGNWRSSNQPDFDPFEAKEKLPSGFQRTYNREYHAIVQNRKLADVFATYIGRDYKLTAAQQKVLPFTLPDLFVPLTEPLSPIAFAARAPEYFEPLTLSRVIKVQPVLTPDNYAQQVLKLIRGATKSIWFQNQYINFRNDGQDLAEFQALVCALQDKVEAGLDVRIICRDMMSHASLDILLAMGFPRNIIRFQKACHNKTIIVDGRIAMFGSQNWSNEGVGPNRDASLIFFDAAVAKYLSGVYEYDWTRLATAKPAPNRVRVARKGEKTPKGMKRVAASAVIED